MSTQAQKEGYPSQIKYIVWNEACERYSYYGMKSILTIFLVQYLLLSNADAIGDYHFFSAACYFFPVLGGYLSDRFLGKYKTIIILSLVYCLGHGLLAMFEDSKSGFYMGLALIALGSGGIKPCVSAHVGDQFKPYQKKLLRRIFELFYWMINFGSTISTLITPWTLQAYGPGVAFGIPGILMLIATFIFWLGRNEYVHIPPTGYNTSSPMKVFVSAIKSIGRSKGSFLDGAKEKHPVSAVEDTKAAFSVGKIFIAVSFFWALFDQHGSSWVLQAKVMELKTPFLSFIGINSLLPSQIPALNPMMVMGLIPIFSFIIYPFFEKIGLKPTPLRRMSVGMFLATISFVFVGAFQFQIDSGDKLHVLWQIIPYLVITMAEVLVSITGLEFAYTQAPRSMKSTIMSMWFLTMAFGNIITGFISKFSTSLGFTAGSGNFFMFFAILMAVFAVIFAFMAKNYKMKDFMESGDPVDPTPELN